MDVDEALQTPPKLAKRVRRLELVAGGVVALLLLLTGMVYLGGFAGSADPGTQERTREFRPLVADYTGAVEYRPANATTWRPLRWSDAFEEGDQVRTGDGASLDVLLTWGTGFRVAPGSELTWRRLQSDGHLADVELHLAKGSILASLEGLPEGSRFIVETKHSRTRVKGTVLDVLTDPESTRTTVLEGVVEVIDRSDPGRRVEVSAGRGALVGDDEARLDVLTAEERAKLLAENAEVRERLERLSPPSPEVEVTKGRVEISSEAPRALEELRAETGFEPSRDDALEGVVRSEAEEVRAVIRAALLLLNNGRVEQALSYCTPTFRSVLWGTLAQRAGAPREYSREAGASIALQARDRVQANIRLTLELLKLEITLDGDVAYGEAIVLASATAIASNRTVERRYACTARCLRQGDGRWLVDLATALEGQGGR